MYDWAMGKVVHTVNRMSTATGYQCSSVCRAAGAAAVVSAVAALTLSAVMTGVKK